MSFSVRDIQDQKQWEQEACEFIVKAITDAIRKEGEARVALAGGSTPVPIYRRLAEENITWNKCIFTLTDERNVEITSSDRNELMLRNTLINRTGAKFVELSETGPTDKLLRMTQKGFHLVVLGMGEDGHIASIFPSTDATKKAFSENYSAITIKNTAPDEPKDRISLSPSCLLNTQKILLLIKGEKKKQVLDKAKQKSNVLEYPVSMLFNQDKVPVLTLWVK